MIEPIRFRSSSFIFLAICLTWCTLISTEAVAQEGGDSTAEVYAEQALQAIGCAADLVPGPRVPIVDSFVSIVLDTGENVQAVVGSAAYRDGGLELGFTKPNGDPLTDIDGNPLNKAQYFEISGCTVLGNLVQGPQTSLLRPIVAYQRELFERFNRSFDFYVNDPATVQSERLEGCGTHERQGEVCIGLTAGIYEDVLGADVTDGWFQITNGRVGPETIANVAEWEGNPFALFGYAPLYAGGPVRAEVTLKLGTTPIYTTSVNLSELRGGGQISLRKLPYSSYRYLQDLTREESLSADVTFRDLSFFGTFSGSRGDSTGTVRLTPEGATFPPSTPSLSVAEGENTITLSISGDASDYVIHRSTESGFTPTESSRLTSTTESTYTDADSLIAGQQYYYKAIAVSANSGKYSAPSEEVEGQIRSEYRITGLDASTQEAIAYDQGTIEGRVETIEGDPVPNANVTLSIPDIEWTASSIITNDTGNFSTQYFVPGKEGVYTLRVTARAGNTARSKTQSLIVSPRPEWGRDLSLSTLAVADSLVEGGDVVEVDLGVLNNSTQDEQVVVTYTLVRDNGTESLRETQEAVVFGSSSQLISSTLSLPSNIPRGSYQLKASIENTEELDENPSDNTTSTDIYVDPTSFSSPVYRTQSHSISGLGNSIEVDNQTVTLEDFTDSTVTLRVGGEQTGELPLDGEEQAHWVSGTEDFLLLPRSFAQSDSTVTFDAGRSTTSTSVAPQRLQARRGARTSFTVQYRDGQSPTPSNITFPFGADRDTLNTWIGNAGNDFVDDRTATLGLEVERTAVLRDYSGWMEWSDPEYSFYKEVAIRSRPLHDLEIANVDVESIIPESNEAIPDFIPGATVRVTGEVQNKGDYLERFPLSFVVRKGENAIFSEEVYVTVDSTRFFSSPPGPGTVSFSFEWPTTGLEVDADYTISLALPESSDESPADNQYEETITLITPPEIDVEVRSLESPVEVGDEVRARAFVGSNDIEIDDASVTGTVLFPGGREKEINLEFNPETSFYEGTFYANFGGNYRLRVQAERPPYRPGEAENLTAKAYVDVSTEIQQEEVVLAKSTFIDIQTTNVAGLHGASIDVLYDDSVVDYHRSAETPFLSDFGSFDTSVQTADQDGRVVAGITRLGQTAGATSTRGANLLSMAFIGVSPGDASFSLDNVGLADSYGEPMAVRAASSSEQATIVEQNAAVSIISRDTVDTAVERDTSWISLTDAYRLKGFEAEISLPSDKVNIISVVEGDVLSENWEAETLFVEDIDQEEGTVQFAITRTGQQAGVEVSSGLVAGVVYDPLVSGNVPVQIEAANVISSYNDLSMPHLSRDGEFVLSGEGDDDSGDENPPDPTVAFTADTLHVNAGEVVEAHITAAHVNNLSAFAAELPFDSDQLSFVDVIEGPVLSDRGRKQTSLTYETRLDTVVVGITQLGEDQGVNVAEADTLCTVRFDRSGGDPTNLVTDNVGLLYPDGTSVPSIEAADTLHIQETTSTSPGDDATTLSFSPTSLQTSPGELFTLAVTVENVEDLFSVAPDLVFDPNQLTYVESAEGPLLGRDGASTSFTTQVDNEAGVLVVGLSRIGNDIGGISTTEADTLFTATFRRDGDAEAQIRFNNTGLIEPDGITQIPFESEPFTILDAVTPVEVSLTDGFLYTPPSVQPGTDANPVGRLGISANAYGAALQDLRVALNGSGQGVNSVELWKSTDETFDATVAEELAAVALNPDQDVPSSVNFDGLAQNLTEAGGNLFLVVDLDADATGSIEPVVESGADVSITGGVLTNAPENFPFFLSGESVALPVELASFEGMSSNDGITLTWQTASETNNAGFNVQRFHNGQWETLSFIEGAGTTPEPQDYRFHDARPPYADSLVYRLEQVDTDGSVEVSPETVVRRTPGTEVIFESPFPNPARQRITVQYVIPEGVKQPIHLSAYNMLGQRIATLAEGTESPGRKEISVNVSGWASGTYFLRLRAGDVIENRRVTVVR